MTESNPYHDIGGLDFGPVDVDAGADYELWEKRVDAMLRRRAAAILKLQHQLSDAGPQ